MLPETYDTRSDGRAPWRQTGADLYTHGDVKSDPEGTALPGDRVQILSSTFIFSPVFLEVGWRDAGRTRVVQ